MFLIIFKLWYKRTLGKPPKICLRTQVNLLQFVLANSPQSERWHTRVLLLLRRCSITTMSRHVFLVFFARVSG